MTRSRDTRMTLIRRVCDPGDQEAWIEFDRVYRRFISYVLGQIGVAAADIDDVAQQIMVDLIRDLPGYDRERARFRTWLSAVIRHAAFAYLRRARRQLHAVGSSAVLDQVGEGVSSEPEIDCLIEAEWATYISNLAMDRVREKFQGGAMEVFEMTLDEVPVPEIAKRTRLTVASVYTLRKRVKKRLYLEIRSLIRELEPE